MDATRADAAGGFAPDHPWDRNFFLVMAGLIWLGILMGFGGDIVHHIQSHASPYPPIVHFHAVAFVGWLVLFTVQIGLIRSRRHDTHKKLGLTMIGLAVLMAVLGPATAMIVQRIDLSGPHPDPTAPAFLAVQFTDILAFVGLISAAVLLRHIPSAHKRLVLLATAYISDAGFARWLGEPIFGLVGNTMWTPYTELYLASDILVLLVGLYDLVTRRRLHPAWLVGAAWIALNHAMAIYGLASPAWLAFATHLLGHG